MALQYKKTRRPHTFADDDYMNFTSGVLDWGDKHTGDPDFYPHYANLPPLKHAFDDSLRDYDLLKQVADEKHKTMLSTVEPVRQTMIGLRRLLPSLFGDDKMLDDFSLRDAIPTDVDKLLIRARGCKKHWDEVSNEPEYAPVAPKFVEFEAALVLLEQMRHESGEALFAMEAAQNAKLDARAACDDEERKMFNWYRGLHTKPESEWWTQSPWGAASGGGDDKKFPAPKMLMYDQFRNEFSWGAVPEANKYILEITEKQAQETITIETDKNMKRVELEDGDYSTKVRAVKQVEGKPIYSKWSDVFDFVIKPAPDNFKFDAPTKKLKWNQVAGATMYEVRQEGSFAPVYLGSDTSFVLDLPAGQYKLRVRAGDEMQNWWSEWSETLLVVV